MEGTSAKILLRQDYKKSDGRYPVYLQVIINRKPIKISLKNVSVKELHWDEKKGAVKKGDPEHLKKNLVINSALVRAEKILNDYKINFKPLDSKQFLSEFNPPTKVKTTSFIEYAKEYIETMYRSNGSYDTYRTRKSFLNKVKLFVKGDLLFEDITLDFIEKFKESMIVKDKNSTNSVARILKTMKTIINDAIANGLIKENIFDKIKIYTKEGQREALTDDEVCRLEALVKSNDTPQTTKKALIPFLFSVYTGIRFRDISDLRFKNLIKTHEKGTCKEYLQFTMHKTKDEIRIPLGKKAIALLPPKTYVEAKIFRVYSNQPLNRYLKDAMKQAGIKKEITFHCARHTFATLALDAEVPIEIVSKLLGHSSLKPTQTYAKPSTKLKENAINKLNNHMEKANKRGVKRNIQFCKYD